MNRLKQISFLLAAILVIALTVPACASQVATEQTTESWFRSHDYTGIMTIVSPGDDPNLFYAKQALENCLYVYPGLEPYQYEGEIDWNIRGRPDSWYLYFQNLQIVGHLSNAAETTREPQYLEKAAEIIESWYDFHADNEKPPPYAWDDHGTAARAQSVIHFLRAYQSLEDARLPEAFFDKVYAMLLQHGNFLLDEKNYKPNNHGLMASRALTEIAITFPEFDDNGLWRETGLNRIRERISADLSTENVHLEHSAFYHLYFLNLVLNIDNYLDKKGINLLPPDDSTIEDMKGYIGYLVMPNHHFPQVGDTSDFVLRKNYDHPFIEYSLSDGLEGTQPPANSVVYPDAGMAILRDGWKPGSGFADTTYLFFQSAFHSTVHKHADDLAFILYSHGENILMGPGVYAYGGGDYRNYVRSTSAHNTLTVDGNNYRVDSDKVGKASITSYHFSQYFDFVQGSHTMYDGVTLKRGIVLIRPSTILVIDEAVSDTRHSIQQIWNLPPEAHGLTFSEQGASYGVGDKGVKVEIRQLGNISDVRHYRGQEDPVRGFTSPKQGTVIPIDQLEFESSGKKVTFVTQISVAGPDETMPDIEVTPSRPYKDIEVDTGSGSPLVIDLSQIAGISGAGNNK